MRYELFYAERAKRDLSQLDQVVRRRILKKIDFFITATDPLSYSKPLSGSLAGLHRWRIGDYRAIFAKQDTGELMLLQIISVKHRREVYK